MKHVILYSRPMCSWCLDAKEYLQTHEIEFEEIDVGRDLAAREEMERISGQPYVPTIVVDGQVLANFDTDELARFLEQF